MVGPELVEAIAAVAAGAAMAIGAFLNNLADRRRNIKTNRWKMSPTEARVIGEATAELASKRVPDALADGDGPQVLQVGLGFVSYAIRNMLGVAPDALEPGAPGAGPEPPPAPQRPSGWPTAPEHRVQPAPPPPPEPPAPPPARIVPRAPVEGVEPPATQADPDLIAQLTGEG